MCDWRLGPEWQHSGGEVVTRTRYPDRKGGRWKVAFADTRDVLAACMQVTLICSRYRVMPLGVRKKIAFDSGVDPHDRSRISPDGWYHESHVRAHVHIGIPVASGNGMKLFLFGARRLPRRWGHRGESDSDTPSKSENSTST